jgi:hypothetical protein
MSRQEITELDMPLVNDMTSCLELAPTECFLDTPMRSPRPFEPEYSENESLLKIW